MQTVELEKRVQTVCLLILSAVAIAVTLRAMQSVLVPVVLAFFLTIVLNPIVGLQVRRLGLPRAVAVASTVFLGFLAMLGLLLVISIAVSQFTDNVKTYQSQIEKLYTKVVDALPLERIGVDESKLLSSLSDSPSERVADILFTVLRQVFTIASQGVLVLIFLFFLLVGGKADAEKQETIWTEIDDRVKQYLIAKTGLSIFAGLVIWAILSLLGVPLALTFGLMVFLLNFVPNIGSIIATLLPLPIVLLNPEVSTLVAVLAIAIPAGVQFVLGSFVEPRILGNSLDLHPATILFALIFWGALWGIVGMLLAAPITAVMRILLEKLEITAPIARFLAGRKKAEPVASHMG
jgi:AI-2 transport protein TqsA